MMPNKQPNYLATLVEKQAAKGATLPASISSKMNKLMAYTQELKTILADSLPNEISNTLLVVGFDNQQLTLAVDSQTAANHLIYLNKPLMALIASQSLTFAQLNVIKVIVMYPPNTGCHTLLKASHLNLINSDSHAVKDNSLSLSESPNDLGLPSKTKQTITHTIEHVITDEALKKSLRKLLE